MFLMVVVNLYASSCKNDLWFAFLVLFSFHFLLMYSIFTRTVEQKSFAFMHGADRDRPRV